MVYSDMSPNSRIWERRRWWRWRPQESNPQESGDTEMDQIALLKLDSHLESNSQGEQGGLEHQSS